MNPRKITDEEIRLILKLRAAEISVPLIAKRLGWSAAAVYNVLKHHQQKEPAVRR